MSPLALLGLHRCGCNYIGLFRCPDCAGCERCCTCGQPNAPAPSDAAPSVASSATSAPALDFELLDDDEPESEHDV